MSRPELPAQAANILRAVEDGETCDSTVVESLKSLLLPSAPTTQKESSVRNPTRSKGTTSAKSNPAASTARAKKQPAVETLDCTERESYDSLQPRQRLFVATQVFNVTLKALTIAIKTARAPQSPSPKSKAHGTPIRGQTPLQPICVNQVLQSPAKSKNGKRASSTLPRDSSIVRVQAECSRVGLACLRSLQSIETLKSKFAPLQLENGMSALIAKLLTLGFDDLALSELRILRRRIEGHSSSQNGKTLARTNTSPSKDTLPDLLKYDSSHLDKSLLSLVTTSQTQVLKILISKRHGQSIDAVVQHLRFDTEYSPSNLIQNQMNPTDTSSKNNAARQLEMLAQTIIGLCPSASKTSDGDCKLNSYPSAQTTLELQSLALQIRIRWWNLSNHQPDINVEVLSPFARYLGAFERRCSLQPSIKYCTAKSSFDAIVKALSLRGSPFQSDSLAIFQTLAKQAGAAGRNDEAIKWIEQGLAIGGAVKISHLQRCELLCRLATRHLKENERHSDESRAKTLQNAIDGIEGDLSGESADLDELLFAVAELRKLAFSAIYGNANAFDSSQITQETSILGQCVLLILLSVRFLSRFTGRQPAPDLPESKLIRYKQRRSTAKQMLPSMIASVIAVSKLSLKSNESEWQRFDAAFKDILDLSSRLDAEVETLQEPKTTLAESSSPWVSISSIYWLRSLADKKVSGEGRGFIESVKKSVDVLEDRPIGEKIQGAYLTKIEKFGSLCEKSRDYGASAKYSRKSIEFLIDFGGVSRLTEAATSVAWHSAVASNIELQETSRVISAFPKTMMRFSTRTPESKIFFDAESLPASQRGLILEVQLNSLISLLLDREASNIIWTELHSLWEITTSLYDGDSFLGRRIHVCIQLLHLFAVLPVNPGDATQSKILEKAESQSRGIEALCETSPQTYLPHLLSRVRLYRVLNERSDASILENTLIDWYSLVQSCPERQALEQLVYDVSGWLQQLDLISEHLLVSGEESLRTAVLNLAVLIREGGPSSSNDIGLGSSLMNLGLHYGNIGYSGQGGLTLQRAQRSLNVSAASWEVRLQWFVVNADHALMCGNIENCGAFIKSAYETLQTHRQTPEDTTNDRASCAQTAADLTLIQSKLHSEQGHPEKAFLFARAAVQEYQRVWASLSRRMRKSRTDSPLETPDEYLVAAISELSVSGDKVNSDTSSRNATLCILKSWYLTPRLFAATLHLTRCFAHAGLFLEAQYYLDQCQKIADAVRSQAMIRKCLTLRGEFAVCGGEIEKGLTMLRNVEHSLSDLLCDYQNVILHGSVAYNYIKAHQIEAGSAACDVTLRRLQSLTLESAPNRLLHNSSKTEQLNLQLANLNLGVIKKDPPKKGRTVRSKPVKSSTIEAKTEVISKDKELLPSDITPLRVLKGEIIRHTIIARLDQGFLDSAATLLDQASKLSERPRDLILMELLRSQVHLRQSLQQLAVHPVLSVLPESTLCCPSVITHAEPETLPKTLTRKSKSIKTTKSKTTNQIAVPKDTPATGECLEHLPLAQKCLLDVVNMARKVSSTSTMHTISDTLSKILTMLAVLPSRSNNFLFSSQMMAYTTELGRQIAMEREYSSIKAECLLSGSRKIEILSDLAEDGQLVHPQHNDFLVSTFQEDYLDIIPKSWTVLSITLSESQDEMRLSRMRAGQSPFILRLPFNRENASDHDEDEGLTFGEGRAEMLDIIQLANSSAHNTGDLSQKGAKKLWWDTRATLDTRLKDLLTNIESIWFGGFRGIFSSNAPQPHLLARFEKSLENILGKHLPSRQASAKVNYDDQLRLDSRILELFVGLGSPTEENEVDEQLMDLLYFVVDILQFQKERNAYDEIDFDAIVVETIDALRQYHQAAAAAMEDLPGNRHTILILDRNLHCFPWESMPCMDGQSVSRLPSLGCLRQRILRMREEQHGESSPGLLEGLRVDSGRGSYMLNPGGDLANTQATFEKNLRELPSWNSFIERNPTEIEMKSCLQDNNVFLYFGHGSGGQYIRSRTIKKLDKCAVTLLMGCSSGALTQAGEFEAYGTPITYMHAGCPALLATLWDVTDKDIDRFSDQVLKTWGLFKGKLPASTSSPVKKSAKSKGKAKMKAEEAVVEDNSRSVSLSEAVASSRDSCILKYLNGAAPVLYGIPVYIG